MEWHAYPILEYDPTPEAVIEPSRVRDARDVPERCVICFFQEAIAALREAGRATPVYGLTSEIGEHPVQILTVEGERIGLFHPGIGAPLAAGLLDELIADGFRKFIACGGAGVLDRGIARGHLLVPVSAVRDEGTSYHYLPPSREVEAHPAAVAAIEATLSRHGLDYLRTKTWTTDALYRETPARVARRREEGCLAVEMEAAAFFAVAQFRGAIFGQILYGGDDVSGTWDSRDWNQATSTRERLLELAVEACLAL